MERHQSMRDMLSPREKQLLEMAVVGMTDQAISNKLGISLATVGTYWGRVRIKFGPYNRTELVALYLKEDAKKALDSLRSENTELLAKLDEEAHAAEMLQSNLDFFRSLIETAPDAILFVNGSGIIELANDQADQMFGAPQHGLVGKKVEDLIPERYHEAHVANRKEYIENPVRRKMGEHEATVAKRLDGTEFPIAAALSASHSSKGTLVTCIIRDMSEGRELATAGAWESAKE